MKNYAKKLSLLLALILTLTGFQGLFSLSVFADEPAADSKEEEEELPDYTKLQFATGQAKLDDIRSKLAYDEEGNYLGGSNLFTRRGDYYLYVDGFSGEVIWQNRKTGEMLFSNPYDVAYPETAGKTDAKQKLLSQILLSYDDSSVSDQTMNSYRDACQNEQISLKYITNGIRVNYSIGEEEARKLVPRMIEKSRFESLILNLVPEGRDRELLLTYYALLDQSDENLTDSQRNHLKQNYPITNTMAVYVFDSAAQKRELTNVEGIISRYTEYTFDDLNEDHSTVGYVGNDAAPPVFKMGLEYTLAEDGSLQVRLASSGIRYDEDNYKLKSISILPIFGASSNKYQGYTFLPDGSGALIENGDEAYTLAGQMYGRDFAYHQISGANQELMRMPVFGVVQYTDPVVKEEESDVAQTDAPADAPASDEPASNEPTDDNPDGEPTDDPDGADEPEDDEDTRPAPSNTVLKPDSAYGYLAVIEEGSALASIRSEHGGAVYKYSSVYTSFSPRASDTYDLKGSLAASGNTKYTVNSKRI